MALILRRQRRANGKVLFNMSTTTQRADDVEISIPEYRWFELGSPDKLAITFEPYIQEAKVERFSA